MNNSQSLLSVKNLNISTKVQLLVKNFNLELKAGECIGISAPTGSGKTSLFNYIADLLPKKEFTIKGELVKAPNLKIAYVFQEPRLIPGISALKNVMLPLENIMESERAISAARVWLQHFKLLNKAEELPDNLSGGEQQRVNLARAFAYLAANSGTVPEPVEGLLLLDEPFASQDEENARNIQSLIKEMLFMQKKSALIISHDKNLLKEICNKVEEL